MIIIPDEKMWLNDEIGHWTLQKKCLIFYTVVLIQVIKRLHLSIQ